MDQTAPIYTNVNPDNKQFTTPTAVTTPRIEPMKEQQTPRRLSWEELKRKRSLGLCFSCEECYSPGHKCSKPQLFIMEGLHDDEEDSDSDIGEGESPLIAPEITLHALTGWDSPQTIRIKARIQKHTLVVLINSGSTYNFINEKTARASNLFLTPIRPFNIKVADDSPLRCIGKYEKVPVTIGDATFSITMYSLALMGLDMVLDVEWLETLGPMLCDWK